MTDDALTLDDLLPDALWEHPDCFDSRRYHSWEQNVATPHLESQGYEVLRWYSTDEDSFGPLVRAVDLRKDGVTRTYFYG